MYSDSDSDSEEGGNEDELLGVVRANFHQMGKLGRKRSRYDDESIILFINLIMS